MKFYKVYEILDNTEEELEEYLFYFVGAFKKETGAIELCRTIDIADCNSTHIEFGEINEEDIKDLMRYGLKGVDMDAAEELKKILTKLKKEDERLLK